MAMVNVFLPDPMTEYISERLSDGGYNTTSDYVRDLIRDDQRKRAEERVEALLLRGLESPATEWTGDDVGSIKKAVRERLTLNQNTDEPTDHRP